ncbi:MAG: hypothetical protein KDJ74_06380, partial [Notoacmeibacter sp.]|nr:hypothetical protein [Notoacmeibacter sp.]
MMTLSAAVLTLLGGLALPAEAVFERLPDTAEIVLNGKDGSEQAIGTVTFGPMQANGERGFAVDLSTGPFSEHFLSMRPFRCLETETEWYCHLPYPYSLRGTISADDMTDLEYSLLFIRKAPAEFGIDAWNGLYFRLRAGPLKTLQGTLMEGDFNVLASPPEQGNTRPLDPQTFIEGDAQRRAFPSLVIR